MNKALECHDLLEIKKGVKHLSGQRYFGSDIKSTGNKSKTSSTASKLKIFCTVKETTDRLKRNL